MYKCDVCHLWIEHMFRVPFLHWTNKNKLCKNLFNISPFKHMLQNRIISPMETKLTYLVFNRQINIILIMRINRFEIGATLIDNFEFGFNNRNRGVLHLNCLYLQEIELMDKTRTINKSLKWNDLFLTNKHWTNGLFFPWKIEKKTEHLESEMGIGNGNRYWNSFAALILKLDYEFLIMIQLFAP